MGALGARHPKIAVIIILVGSLLLEIAIMILAGYYIGLKQAVVGFAIIAANGCAGAAIGMLLARIAHQLGGRSD